MDFFELAAASKPAPGAVLLNNIPYGSAIEDVFSAYTYTGTGAAQNINTGINLIDNSTLQLAFTQAALSVRVDSAGNIYVLSYSSLVKFNASWVRQWEINITPTNATISNPSYSSLSIDATGNVYVSYGATTPITSGVNDAGYQYVTGVVQINPGGTINWTASLEDIDNIPYDGQTLPGFAYLNSVHIDTAGNVYACGQYASRSTYVNSSPLLIKFSSAGAVLWVSMALTINSIFSGVKTDTAGNVYVAGNDYDGTLIRGWMLILDTNGNVLSNKDFYQTNEYTSSTNDVAFSNTTGFSYFVGMCSPAGAYTALGTIICSNSSGAIQWQKQIPLSGGLTTTSIINRIKIDSSGNIYLLGTTQQTVSSSQYIVPFILKLDSSGTFIWLKILGVTSTPIPFHATAITFDISNNVLVSGYFNLPNNLAYGTVVSISNDGSTIIATDSHISISVATVSLTGVSINIGAAAVTPTLYSTLSAAGFSAFSASLTTIAANTEFVGRDGLVWIKDRSQTASNELFDTIRGSQYTLSTDSTSAQLSDSTSLTSFNVNGFSLGSSANENNVSDNFIAWTFARAPKFFDIVEYVGNGTTQVLNHVLGVVPGMIIIKDVGAGGGDWSTFHNYNFNNIGLLDSTGVFTASSVGTGLGNGSTNVAPTSTQFTVGSSNSINASGHTYIAYLFAHDPSAAGMIQCGSFMTDGSGNATITLGWEPQYVLVKNLTTGRQWLIEDTARSMSLTNGEALYPSSTGAENYLGQNGIIPNASGFTTNSALAGNSVYSYVYMAIRKSPMRVPTSGTQVYNAIARTGTGAVASVTGVGFSPDVVLTTNRNNIAESNQPAFLSRLIGPGKLLTTSNINGSATEVNASDSIVSFDPDGISVGADSWQVINTSAINHVSWFFKRAPGFMDEVCFTGPTGAPYAHNLGVIPELVIYKSRTTQENWWVFQPGASISYLVLNNTSAYSGGTNSATATATTFNVIMNSTANYVAYLFASLPGISKIGTYTGNGSSQTINCGFTSGARFVLIKRTDSAGDWYVWDTVRGITTVGTNDPHLSLNTTSIEVTTDDSLAAAAAGFTVEQNSQTNINVTSGTYLFFAIA